jgi:sodium/hydrogen antiporter
VLADANPGFSLAGAIPEVLLLAALAALVAIGALSHEEDRPFSASLVYLAMGAIGALVLRALDVTPLSLVGNHGAIEVLTDVTVAVAVFATGLRLRRVPLWHWRTLALLLLVTMPLTTAVVALFAKTAMGLPLGVAIALGATLAPTDPVLAGNLGLGPPGESDDQPRARGALTAEAGANDGAAMPLLVLGLLIARHGDFGRWGTWLGADLLYALAVSVVLGAAGGWGFAAAHAWLCRHDFLDEGFEGWAAVAIALILYGIAELAGGYGFVAAFAGGIAFRHHEYDSAANRTFHDGAGAAENALELAVIVLLGTSLTTAGLGEPKLAGWLLAPLLLLIVRPLAALLALIRSDMPWNERLFVAWFGVKGVAALNYALVALAAGGLGAHGSRVLWTTVACIIVSIALHGVTAAALTRRLLGEEAA